MAYQNDDLNLKATELRLGLPGRGDETTATTLFGSRTNKRVSSEETVDECMTTSSCKSSITDNDQSDQEYAPPSKVQIIGWPPVRSYRKNSFNLKNNNEGEGQGMFVKVSMDGAPYLRKIDLQICKGYQDLLKALENLFKFTIGVYIEGEGFKGLEYAPTYEDKDGDWMLVGDVPWDMFITSCKRLRIMRGSEARGLGYGV